MAKYDNTVFLYKDMLSIVFRSNKLYTINRLPFIIPIFPDKKLNFSDFYTYKQLIINIFVSPTLTKKPFFFFCTPPHPELALLITNPFLTLYDRVLPLGIVCGCGFRRILHKKGAHSSRDAPLGPAFLPHYPFQKAPIPVEPS